MMDGFEEIANQARLVRAIALQTVLAQTGCSRDALDPAKWHTPAGVISVTGQKFMNWTTRTGGGGAIDLVMQLRRCGFKAAVLWLSQNISAAAEQASHESTCIAQPAFALPKRDDSRVQQIRDYLSNHRCIPSELIDFLIRAGTLYADDRANAVFLLLGKEKTVVGAELRGTSQSRWHGLAPGSRKDLGCFYVKTAGATKVVLCESAIDAISYFALQPNCTALSTAGVNPNPGWLSILVGKGFDIYCGFDSDDTGDALANRMIRRYPTVKRLRPPNKDWNEVLQSKSALH